MTAKNSYYWHRENWNIDTTPPGRPISAFTAMAMSAALGLIFVVFLPVIGFVMVGQALIKKISEMSKPLVQGTLAPQPVPGEAHLTGAPGSSEPNKSDAGDETLAELSKEIQERRAQK